jgi:hypothetical protein
VAKNIGVKEVKATLLPKFQYDEYIVGEKKKEISSKLDNRIDMYITTVAMVPIFYDK